MPNFSGSTTAPPDERADRVVEPLLALFGLFKEHADSCISAVGITMPPWPGDGDGDTEAMAVAGPWQPSAR